MLKQERFEYILAQLRATSKVTFDQLAGPLNVSEDTVRRDIDELTRNGLLVKVRGGAVSPSRNPLAFQARADLHTEGKQIVALKAVQLLPGVRTVFMDGGTTVLALASCIPIDARLRIVTNNVALIPVLAAHECIEILVLGGTYHRTTQTSVGVQTCREISRYQADLYLMGTCAISSRTGLTASILDDGEVKKAFASAALKTVVLGTKEKLETTDFFKVGELNQIDTLITDLPSDDRRLDPYRPFGIEIL